ncbi:MAG: hypothetical protein WAO35_17940 [Terriglobia bacterium]
MTSAPLFKLPAGAAGTLPIWNETARGTCQAKDVCKEISRPFRARAETVASLVRRLQGPPRLTSLTICHINN